MTITAVVFDLDGTITSFNVDYMTIRAEVRSLLISVGLPASVLSTTESIFEMLKKAEIFMKNNGKSEKAIETVQAKALAIAEKYELEAAKNTSLLSGVTETLKAIKKMGLKIGLCTINSERATDYILKRFKIASYFDVLVPRNKVKYVKPNSEHLEAVMKALEAKPEETIVIGDGVGDIKCARELNAIAVGLLSGISTMDKLIDSGANYVVSSIAEAPTLIEQLNRV